MLLIQEKEQLLRELRSLNKRDDVVDNRIEQLKDDLFLFHKPIPISRIKKICFANKAQIKNTIYNIEKGTAFVPNDIVEYIETDELLNSNIELKLDEEPLTEKKD